MENKNQKTGFIKMIVLSGVLVGTLDIMAACIQTLINGRKPVNMLKFISTGVFGKDSMAGGDVFAFYGLVFHYCIAFGWTYLFFILYAKWSLLSRSRILTGVAYGIFIFIMMSQIVLPLSNAPVISFTPAGAITAILILSVAIGLPLSLLASRYYSAQKDSE